MSVVRIIYLLFLVLGIVMPLPHYWAWFEQNPGGIASFLDAASVNHASAAMAMSLFVTGVVTTVFASAECIARRDRIGWIAVPVTVFLGPSVGLPLYLFLRSRQVR